jgi:predicted thioredoxin/glutaredoxin
MPYRNRTVEQLMRSILESQAAMLSAMTPRLFSALYMTRSESIASTPPIAMR